jgi:hypothetical protein
MRTVLLVAPFSGCLPVSVLLVSCTVIAAFGPVLFELPWSDFCTILQDVRSLPGNA